MSEHLSRCELCGCPVRKLERHHLVPKLKCKKMESRFRDSDENLIKICSICHRTIHAYFPDNGMLRDNLDTKEKLIENEKFRSYLAWRQKHQDFDTNSVKRSNRYV